MPVDAIDALSDAALSFYAQDLAAALRDTAGPLVVAAELRRLAAEWDPQLDDPHATHGERHHRGASRWYARHCATGPPSSTALRGARHDRAGAPHRGAAADRDGP